MFSRQEVQLIWIVTNLCAEARSESDLTGIIKGPLRSLLPHGCCAFGQCQVSTDTVLRVVNVDFPQAVVSRVAQVGRPLSSPLAAQWKQHRKVVHVAAQASAEAPLEAAWLGMLREQGLSAVTAHGAIDLARDRSSYFAFGETPVQLPERDRILLNILVPHLHDALTACPGTAPPRAPATSDAPAGRLSEREVEVLHWVQAGKTNGEIGSILGISEFTVKNHMQRILGKLNATNRAHAISKATRGGQLGVQAQPALP